jgi:hypothetical protein
MTVRFDSISAKSFRIELQVYHNVLFVLSWTVSPSWYKVGDCILPRVGTILGSTGPPTQHPWISRDRTFNGGSHYCLSGSATLPPLWSTGFSLQIRCPAILILYTLFNQMCPVQMDITILTSTPRISNKSPSVWTEASTTQCGLSYDHWPTSWRRRLSATVCWSGSMIMRPLLMELTKATARTLQVTCYYPVYLVVATNYIYRLSRSGSPANLHIYTESTAESTSTGGENSHKVEQSLHH